MTVKYSFPYIYNVYGIGLHSQIPLPLPTRGREELSHIALRTQPAEYFAQAIEGLTLEQADGSSYQIGWRMDGSVYARRQGVGEFLVSASGLQIECRQFDVAPTDSFHVDLLNQAISFALVKRGFEPIHATALAIHGEAVVFLGDSGFGKSTLAASFISAGYPMLTDDLLMLQVTGDGVLAYPGPARIQLFSAMAVRFLGQSAAGVSMKRDTEKLIITLDAKQCCSMPLPVGAVYSLTASGDGLATDSFDIEPMTPREAFVELVKNTFNPRIGDSKRFTRQLTASSRLADALPARRLSIPRDFDLDRLPSLRAAILADLSSLGSGAVRARAAHRPEGVCAR